ncbi:MAG: flavodoxin family protein [Candidatus Aminicenantes bacterium]|nr:flavodoxin family protein [Candidatus Aminicenantes bacterium]
MGKNTMPLAVGVASSGRRRGNSTTLLKAYLEGVRTAGFKTKIVHLNNLHYLGCQGCDRCVNGKECKLQDDLNDIFPIMKEARIWALASPIYYDGVSGQLKTFFDRLRFTTYDPNKLQGPRKGIIIVTYEDKPNKVYTDTARHLAKYFDWNNRGNFSKVEVVAEGNLGPSDAWKKRPDLLERINKLGLKQAKELRVRL